MVEDLVNRKKCDNRVHKVDFFVGLCVTYAWVCVIDRGEVHVQDPSLKYKFVRTADKTNNNSTRDAIFHTPEVNNYSLHTNNYHSLTEYG